MTPSAISVRKKASATLNPLVSASYLKHLRIFREVPDEALLLLQGKVRRETYGEGETIVQLSRGEEPFQNFYFIVRGQVKIIGLDEDARSRPLNFLRKGEFFLDKSVNWRGQAATKVVAITDAEILVLPKNELRTLSSQHASLYDRLKAITERVDYRNRIYTEDKYAKSVMDFLVSTELTQASRVKITQLDKCIECNTCYKSCEDRHGFQRLERGYAHFGVLDFAKSCLTCFYPTCIPACPVDSVVFNPQNGEVEILDSCIGCSACSHACQYGAIRMYKVVEGDARFSRFLQPEKKIKPKFVADKCNHCDGYDDMACITHCPTGAIIEVEASDLLENPRIFGAGEGVHNPLPSLTERRLLELLLQKSYIILGVLVTLLLIFEARALSGAPEISILRWLQSMGKIPADFALEFRRGSNYCNFLGNLGFTFILLAMTYPLRKSFPRLFKYLGKKPLWLDFHNFCGILGTILILFHTGLVFPLQPSTFGFLALVAVMLSGIFGRFLYQVIPRTVAGTELKIRDIEEEDAAITQKLEVLLGASTKHLRAILQIVSALTEDAVKRPTLLRFVTSIARTKWLLLKFRFRMPKEIKIHRRQIGVFLSLLSDKVRLQRNVAFLSISSRLFARWQLIHQPMAYVMAAIAAGHIVRNLFFFPNL